MDSEGLPRHLLPSDFMKVAGPRPRHIDLPALVVVSLLMDLDSCRRYFGGREGFRMVDESWLAIPQS